ncbi:MAG: bacillithiol system redox-active protein YtxJ [Acidobacteriota bacterium]
MSAKLVFVETEDQLNAIFERSYTEPVAIFKHSNSCGISADVFEQTAAIDGELNVVVIQEHRPLSNAIAEKTSHRHQSPQAFVIRDGKAVYHATHYGIDPHKIEELLKGGGTD